MLNNKKVLIVGVARSGLASGKLAMKLGACVTFNDSKKDIEIDNISEYEGANWDLGSGPKAIDQYDLIVLSPGVPTDLPFIVEAKEKNVEVIGALEFGYQNTEGKFYGITGTNGKTTTTQLTYEIFKKDKLNAYAAGNIGFPVSAVALDNKENRCIITELSSFQLESIKTFRPEVACFLNMRPDHLNRHKTMENYFDAKCRMYENQNNDDYLLLNYDDETLKKYDPKANGKVLYFSKTPLKEGFYIEDNNIIAHLSNKEIVMSVKDIKIVGQHSLENVLAAVGISYLAGVSNQAIKEAVAEFRGVEHRIELVGEFEGITCYNDSKGTNPDATIVAVGSMTKPTVLIAGGMDKGSDFTELSDLYQNHLSDLILLGETKEIMKQSAYDAGFFNVILVNNMEEAVEKAFEIAKKNGAILLSPACASWDMYDSFEVRGRHFKTCIEKVKI